MDWVPLRVNGATGTGTHLSSVRQLELVESGPRIAEVRVDLHGAQEPLPSLVDLPLRPEQPAEGATSEERVPQLSQSHGGIQMSLDRALLVLPPHCNPGSAGPRPWICPIWTPAPGSTPAGPPLDLPLVLCPLSLL